MYCASVVVLIAALTAQFKQPLQASPKATAMQSESVEHDVS
jgi:hypothetical protein